MSKKDVFEAYMWSVRDAFTGVWPKLDDEEVDNYLGLSKPFIEKRFSEDLKRFQSGEISEEALKDGAGRSVGWCLGHLYDDDPNEI